MTPDGDLSRIGDEVEAYARRRVGPEDALDVRQDVLLKLVINHGRVRAGEEGRWAGRVASNAVIDIARRRSRQALPVGDDLPVIVEPTLGPAAQTVRREDVRLVLTALGQLPPEQAQLLWDATVLEMPRHELTAKYNVTPGALQARLSRARAALKKQFVASGGSLGVFGAVFPFRPRLLAAPGAVAAGAAAAITCALLISPWLPAPFGEDNKQPGSSPSPVTQRSQLPRPHLPAPPEPERRAPSVRSTPPPSTASPAQAQPVARTPPLRTGVVDMGEGSLVQEHEEESFQETLERCLKKGIVVSPTHVECRD